MRKEAHAEAAQAAAELPRLFPDGWEDYHRAGWFLATCAALAEKDAKLAPAQRTALAHRYADEAVVLLRQAIQKGYKDGDHLKTNQAYATLRQREDFKQLLTELTLPQSR